MKPELVGEEKLQKMWIDWCILHLFDPNKSPMRREMFLIGAHVALEKLDIQHVLEIDAADGVCWNEETGERCPWENRANPEEPDNCDQGFCQLEGGAVLVRAKEKKS